MPTFELVHAPSDAITETTIARGDAAHLLARAEGLSPHTRYYLAPVVDDADVRCEHFETATDPGWARAVTGPHDADRGPPTPTRDVMATAMRTLAAEPAVPDESFTMPSTAGRGPE